MSNNYELPPTPPSTDSGVELSPTEQLNQILLSMLESSSQIEPKEKEFFCPFRKQTFFMDCDEKNAWPTTLDQAYYMEEDFLPCLKEKCAMWHSVDDFGFCGINEKI